MKIKELSYIVVLISLWPIYSAAETLTDLEKALLNNNPEIIAARTRYFAARQAPIQEGTLPDPMISFTDFGVRHPFSRLNNSNFAYRGFGFTQDFPFPGKLSLRARIADKKAQVAERDLRTITLRLISEVQIAAAQYVYTQKAIEIAREQQKFLNQISDIAQVKYRVGQGLQQDVLRSQVEQSMIAEKLELLGEEQGEAQASINQLLNRDVSAAIRISEQPSPVSLNLTLEELQERLKENSPELQSKVKAQEQQQLEVLLVRKDLQPDFSTSFQWQRTGSDFQDYYMTMVEARIPLYFWRKQKPAIAQAELQLKATQKDTEATLRKLLADLQKQYIVATRTENLLKLYNQGIVPQTEVSLQSAFAAYQVGKIDFLTLLNNATTLLNYQNELERRVADYEIAMAKIQAITGTPLREQTALLLEEEAGK